MSKYCLIKDGPALYADCLDCIEKECEFFFCLVVGSRNFNNYALLRDKLDYLLQNHNKKVVIVSGGAKGADSLAERYAKERNLPLKIFYADWDKYGKKAGYIRNDAMHQYISKAGKRGCVAFWDGQSHGTAQNFELGKKYGNLVKIITF